MAHGNHGGHGMDHGAGTHVMPDGTVMGGASHESHGGAPATHVMPDGTVMQGAAHGDHGAAPAGTHTMPDGTVMAGADHSAHAAPSESFYAAGSGLTPVAWNGGRFLSYADLVALRPVYDQRLPDRVIDVRLTGNMERYIWSFDGVKHEDAPPMVFRHGERVRFRFTNETMMTHPMHLHGMWFMLDNGNGVRNPVKHVVSVAPGTTAEVETEFDAEGLWLLHCHLAYHMEAGMMRTVLVEGGPTGFDASRAPAHAAHLMGRGS
jgi:L-ascorbate oxidase